MTPPTRSASRIAARAPATSQAPIKNSGSRLAAINAAAACVASASDTDLSSMKQASCGMHPAELVVFHIGEALVARRRSLEGSAFFARLPVHDLFDLFCKLEILVRHATRGMILQAHFDPSIRRGNVRVMPRCLGEVADGVD